LCERELTSAAEKYAVPAAVLYSVGLTETGANGRLQPFALNIDGTPFTASSAEAAKLRVRKALSDGARHIDMGCMQINFGYHASQFPSIDAMLTPSENVGYAARLLSDLYRREGSWTRAVARYNAGPANDPAHRRYVCRVLRNMVQRGFAVWTPAAQDYCQ
jgi:soluble lytic murein transglycosylase-like protein